MNLESKLLDGPNAGYCSSSEGEEEDFKVVNDDDEHQANVMKRFGTSSQTGAKGIMSDFKKFQEDTKRATELKNMSFFQRAKRGMMMGSKEDREKAQKEDKEEEEMKLEDIRAKRLQEMKKAAANRVIEIISKRQYTDSIEKTTDYLLCVLLYEPNHEGCAKITYLCKILAATYSRTKFARANSTMLGMSDKFKANGVPCLQFYKNGELIGNFINVTNSVGHDCDAQRLKAFCRREHIDIEKGGYASDSDIESDDD